MNRVELENTLIDAIHELSLENLMELKSKIERLKAKNYADEETSLHKLEEFDSSQSVTEVMQALSGENYSADFLKDIEKGLKTSTVYAKNED